MICNVCKGSGFKNTDQIPESEIGDGSIEAIRAWIEKEQEPHDVCVCDCCGDGDDWYGEPGQHYGINDPMGMNGPYAYNEGLCECH